ncbi:MAG: hypothetical protein EB078_11405 [Proteobacteria bacterium]|nr:hypothetical protein [Pseudomonadota bacterium]NDD05505.1 hypothetical protein [Pseudomonadota bacterium]
MRDCSFTKTELLLEWRGLALVVGGTLGLSLLIYPFSQLLNLGRFFLYAVLLKKNPSLIDIAKDLLAATALKSNESHLYPLCPSKHPFLTEAYQLLADPLLSESDLREVLVKRSFYFKMVYAKDAKMLSTLGKFPSSLGMLGSTVGLVDMMSGLSRLGQAGIGEAMAMALATTFWGLVLTYLFFVPLADYTLRLNAEDAFLRQLISEGVILIKRREELQVIAEKINGFLSLHERLTLKKSSLPQDYWKEAEAAAERIRKNMQPKDQNQTEAIPFKKKNEEASHDFSFWEQSESHEEKIEVDERWLMTYADKMMLLSGCFLMLFAMSTLDPERMNSRLKTNP